MRGLNLVLSICIGLFFGEVIEGWDNIASGKFFCVGDGAKLLCVIDGGF